MQRSAERDVERNASPHLFTPHSDLPASFASDAPPTGRQWLDTAIRFDQSEESNGWILLSDSTNQRRATAGYCYQILTNQSSPPGMQRAVGYKMHCSFVSPIPFNYAVQKRRRLVREHSEELSKNASIASRGRD